LLALVIAATPAYVFTAATPVLLALTTTIALGAVAVLLRAAAQGRRDAWLMLVGVGALVVTGAHDTIELSSQISNKWGAYGFIAFVLAPALLLGRRFARALEAQELRPIEQQQRANLLLHATQAGVLDWDAVTRRFTYSERLAEMLGHPAGTDTSRWPPL